MLWSTKPAGVSTAVSHGEYVHRKTKCLHGQVKPLPGRASKSPASGCQIHFGSFQLRELFTAYSPLYISTIAQSRHTLKNSLRNFPSGAFIPCSGLLKCPVSILSFSTVVCQRHNMILKQFSCVHLAYFPQLSSNHCCY